MTPDQAAALRAPFPDDDIDRKPQPLQKDAPKGKCGDCQGWHGLPAIHLDYVGHAAATDRLLAVDPAWSWEPVAEPEKQGLPTLAGGMWIRLTVAGVTRYGYGDAGGKPGHAAVKEMVGDAIRNAAMRFGVALDLWRKDDASRRRGREVEDEPTPPPPAPVDKRPVIRAEVAKLGRAGGLSIEELGEMFAAMNGGLMITDGSEPELAEFLEHVRQIVSVPV